MTSFKTFSLTITPLIFSFKCVFKLFLFYVFPFVACYLGTSYFPVLSL